MHACVHACRCKPPRRRHARVPAHCAQSPLSGACSPVRRKVQQDGLSRQGGGGIHACAAGVLQELAREEDLSGGRGAGRDGRQGEGVTASELRLAWVHCVHWWGCTGHAVLRCMDEGAHAPLCGRWLWRPCHTRSPNGPAPRIKHPLLRAHLRRGAWPPWEVGARLVVAHCVAALGSDQLAGFAIDQDQGGDAADLRQAVEGSGQVRGGAGPGRGRQWAGEGRCTCRTRQPASACAVVGQYHLPTTPGVGGYMPLPQRAPAMRIACSGATR